MIKKITYAFIFIFSFFCFVINTSAMTLGGKEVNSPAYTSGNANTWYQFHVWGCDVATNSACTFDVFDFTNSYTYVRACSDMSDVAFSSNYPISPSVIKTNEKCSFSTGYQGYITWIMYKNVPNILNIGNSSITFYDPNPVIINLKSSKAFSFSAQSVYFSKEPLNITSGTNTEDITNNANWNTQKILDSNAVTYNKLNEQVTSTNALNDKVNETNKNLNDIKDMDISDKDKELPDDSSYQNYSKSESLLMDKVNQADLSDVSVGIDSSASSWVWDTLTSLIQSHTVIFGLFISILSIGIIKLALGR